MLNIPNLYAPRIRSCCNQRSIFAECNPSDVSTESIELTNGLAALHVPENHGVPVAWCQRCAVRADGHALGRTSAERAHRPESGEFQHADFRPTRRISPYRFGDVMAVVTKCKSGVGIFSEENQLPSSGQIDRKST